MPNNQPDQSSNLSFSSLLSPISEKEFFDTYFDKKPLYIPAKGSKTRIILDFDRLSQLLSMNAIWNSEMLMLVLDNQKLPPHSYCTQDDQRNDTVMIPDPKKVMHFLEQGATLIANEVETLTPEMSQMADSLESALTGKAQSNLYFSSQRRQGFGTHFDTHDVFAFHQSGEKLWRVYENREPHPIRHEAFRNNPEQARQNRGNILMEVTLKPGDLLYLPRGQYHDALATDNYAIHLAFGISGIIGFDFISMLQAASVYDERFRINFPRLSEGPEALTQHLSSLSAALGDITTSQAFQTEFINFQKQYKNNRTKYHLPIQVKKENFQLTTKDISIQMVQGQTALKTSKGLIPIPADKENIASWIVKKQIFNISEALQENPDFDTSLLNDTIRDFVKMGLLKPSKPL